jgi:multidrug efflux pump subunit AcrA (membrane-fusion protein)
VDALPDAELLGQVTYVAPKAFSSSGVVLYPVTIRLAPETGSGQSLPVRAGMTAEVEITTASREDVLIVPLRAVKVEEERATVDRLAGDGIEQVEVELGLMTETEVEIVTGLSEGDVVRVVPGPSQSSTALMPMADVMRGGEDD